MNSRRWFHLYDVLDRRAQLDDRHVSHLAFDGSNRMVGETVVGPPIPSPPFSPFLGGITGNMSKTPVPLSSKCTELHFQQAGITPQSKRKLKDTPTCLHFLDPNLPSPSKQLHPHSKEKERPG
ncbi:hypothetical protein Tco_0231154 [Tanacetum coccineum]